MCNVECVKYMAAMVLICEVTVLSASLFWVGMSVIIPDQLAVLQTL